MNKFSHKLLDGISIRLYLSLENQHHLGLDLLGGVAVQLVNSFFGGSMALSNPIQSEVGVIGLGHIGRSMAFHLAEQQFNIAAFDWGEKKMAAAREQERGPVLRLAGNVRELMANLRQPRQILVFSGADVPMNLVLEQLLPELKMGDLVMDAGDSYYKDTAKHKRLLARHCVQFLGVGLGGGEQGARHGAIVMAGGGREACWQAHPLVQAMAATVRGQPCVSYFESAAAAHFVQMVHAGIEHALLRLLSETFELLQRTLLLTDEEMRDPLGAWRLGVLNGYLLELSGRVPDSANPQAPRLWLREYLESARSEALGNWLVHSSWELEVPAPTLEAAAEIERVPVTERRQALVSAPCRHPVGSFGDNPKNVLDDLHGALYTAMIITYTQGLALLSAASKQLCFRLNLPEILRAWRGCTRLRTSLLEAITAAFEMTPELAGLLCDDDFSERVMTRQESLRRAVWRAGELDLAAPGLQASLDYLDFSRVAWLPVNVLQAPCLQTIFGPIQMEVSSPSILGQTQ